MAQISLNEKYIKYIGRTLNLTNVTFIEFEDKYEKGTFGKIDTHFVINN